MRGSWWTTPKPIKVGDLTQPWLAMSTLILYLSTNLGKLKQKYNKSSLQFSTQANMEGLQGCQDNGWCGNKIPCQSFMVVVLWCCHRWGFARTWEQLECWHFYYRQMGWSYVVGEDLLHIRFHSIMFNLGLLLSLRACNVDQWLKWIVYTRHDSSWL